MLSLAGNLQSQNEPKTTVLFIVSPVTVPV